MKTANVNKWIENLQNVSQPSKVKILSSFFKTGKGEYGEGDIFAGINVPDNRKIAEQFYNLAYEEIYELLSSPIHEHRLSALLALVKKYHKTSIVEHAEIVNFYLANTRFINNWDLVDLSAPKIIGEYTLLSNEDILYTLSDSESLWERRIAIVATYTHIKKGEFKHTLIFANKYLDSKDSLIHKATGWMLREIGKKDLPTLLNYLDDNYKIMPRTALRYAIERLQPELKRHYMNKD
ncbi:MAG: DNA alkylation repair protein [Muribaculaceae bacterium]|nr:DNA alkylation repair protein [Muribaculaceae bacterium]